MVSYLCLSILIVALFNFCNTVYHFIVMFYFKIEIAIIIKTNLEDLLVLVVRLLLEVIFNLVEGLEVAVDGLIGVREAALCLIISGRDVLDGVRVFSVEEPLGRIRYVT